MRTPSPPGMKATPSIPNGSETKTMTQRAPARASARAIAVDPHDAARRNLLLGMGALTGLAALGAALPADAQSNLSAEDRAALQQAQTYLQNLSAAQGTFVETSGNVRREGRFYLQRPGKMRFEYTNPQGLLVVSDGSNVKRYDPRLNVFRQVPLSATPLSTFLARNFRLDQGVRIERVTRMDSGAFAITARDSRRPNDGQVILAFAGSPMRLREWTITDAQGQRTRTQLTSLQPASGLSASLFQLRDPTRRPGRN